MTFVDARDPRQPWLSFTELERIMRAVYEEEGDSALYQKLDRSRTAYFNNRLNLRRDAR